MLVSYITACARLEYLGQLAATRDNSMRAHNTVAGSAHVRTVRLRVNMCMRDATQGAFIITAELVVVQHAAT